MGRRRPPTLRRLSLALLPPPWHRYSRLPPPGAPWAARFAGALASVASRAGRLAGLPPFCFCAPSPLRLSPGAPAAPARGTLINLVRAQARQSGPGPARDTDPTRYRVCSYTSAASPLLSAGCEPRQGRAIYPMAAIASGRKTEWPVGTEIRLPSDGAVGTCIQGSGAMGASTHTCSHSCSHTTHAPRLPGPGCARLARLGWRRYAGCPARRGIFLVFLRQTACSRLPASLQSGLACFGASLSSQHSRLQLCTAKPALGLPAMGFSQAHRVGAGKHGTRLRRMRGRIVPAARPKSGRPRLATPTLR